MSISRQSLGYSAIGYLGFLLGTLSNLFLFTNDLEFYGRLRFIFSTTQLFLPIVVFGLAFASVKFFPMAQSLGKQHNLLSVFLLAAGIHFLLFTTIFFAFSGTFEQSQVWQLRYVILPLLLFLSLSSIWNKFISNYQKIILSNVFENLFPKLANISAFCYFFFRRGSEMKSYGIFLLFFVAALAGYYCYAHRLEKFRFDFSLDFFKENQRWKSILDFCFYTCLGNLGGLLMLNAGVFFIGEYIDFKQSGIYATLFSIVSLISIPALGVYTISAPRIHQYLMKKKKQELHLYYQQTSATLFFAGASLFSILYVLFPFLTELMPQAGKSLLQAQPLLWIFAVNLLLELATGFNNQIIAMSKYYRIGIVFALLSAAICLILNTIFILFTSLGIWGAALSYSISGIIFNLLKTGFIYHRIGVFPFCGVMLSGLLLCGLALYMGILIPLPDYFWVNFIGRPFITFLLIALGSYLFHTPLSPIWYRLRHNTKQ